MIIEYKFLISSTDYVYTINRELLARGICTEDIYFPQRQGLINGAEYACFSMLHAYFSVYDFIVNKEHYCNVYNRLYDNKSKEIFLAILKFRAYGLYDLDKQYYAPDESYFCGDYLKLGKHECYVDIGAFFGDSCIDFLMKIGHQYDKIYAIEGNGKRCNDLRQRLYMEYEKGKIEIFNVGAGDRRKTISYDGFQGGEGESKLEIYALDELLKGKQVTLIKMDIEGMEMEAIEGAKEIIKSQKPALAICVYHLIDDIWRILEKISFLAPVYKFFLEQPLHQHMLQTVLYAVAE